MRVTESMIFASAISQTETSRENLQQAQNQVSSGLRVVQPGDDPAAASIAVTDDIDQARFTSIGKNAQLAASELDAADTALDGITTNANRALQLATQFGNDTYNAWIARRPPSKSKACPRQSSVF
jgi:flagellar hook-associated protein 3 FlgL